jgi:hypothetical protein
MQVLQLLFHHGIARNRLRMAPFLPNLMGGRLLVCGAKVSQLIEQLLAPFALQLRHDFARGELLQVSDCFRQLRSGDDGVEMIVQHDPGINAQGFMFPAVSE